MGMKKMRLLVCGDRDWDDGLLIENEILKVKDNLKVVIEGEARGADSMARDAAEKHNIHVLKFPANWNLYRRAAGPIRNQKMLDEGNPTHVWAFHNCINESRGTADMVLRSVKAGIPTRVYAVDHGVLKFVETGKEGFGYLIAELYALKRMRENKKKIS